MTDVSRRQFLAALSAAPAVSAVAQGQTDTGDRRPEAIEPGSRSDYVAPDAPIIDCHTHLFDKTRPQGAPYPRAGDLAPGLTMLPPRYRATVHNTGIVGVIVTECSSWPEDTLWVLDLCAQDPLFLGHCGFLDFGTPDFVRYFDRFRANPLFLGVRYQNVGGRNLPRALSNRAFVSDIRTMTDAGLVFEYGNHPADILRLADQLAPTAQIVIPHYPRLNLAGDDYRSYMTPLRELARRPNVAMKLSGVSKIVDGAVVTDLARLRGWLDELWELFGEDRVVFGMDYPHEDRTAPFLVVLHTAVSYVREKSPVAQEKVFWRNSARIYRWRKRSPEQPGL